MLCPTMYSSLLGHVGSCRDLSGPISCCRVLSGPIRSYRVLSGAVRSCQVLSGLVRSYKVRSSPIKSNQVLLGLSGPIRTVRSYSLLCLIWSLWLMSFWSVESFLRFFWGLIMRFNIYHTALLWLWSINFWRVQWSVLLGSIFKDWNLHLYK
jgi:hypothetical protein